MSSEESSLRDFDRRLRRIESALGLRDEAPAMAPSAPAVNPIPTATSSPMPTPTHAKKESAPPLSKTVGGSTGLLLGAVAGLCLILAAVLMIKLAIDSGWLTPVRQVWVTTLFGGLCIATAFVRSLSDPRYASILPGIGVAVLNIAVYGAAFVHRLVEPDTAYIAVNAIAVLCLALYSLLRQDLYVIYAVVGTHLGFIFLGDSAPASEMNLLMLISWNVVFGQLSVRIGSRRLLAVVAYFGFASVYFISLYSALLPAAITQGILFVIYLFFTIRYSRLSGRPLTESEAWSLFPPLLVFYMTEYHWLSQLVGPITPYLFLGFAALVWTAYLSAARAMKMQLASGKLVYLFVGATLIHSFFFQIVPDELKPLAGLAIGGALLAGRRRLDFRGEHFGLAFLGLLTGLLGFFIALIGQSESSEMFRIVNGVAYGGGLLAYAILASREGTDRSLRDFAAILAHLQWMTALYRARTLLGIESFSLAVTVLWILYAFTVFGMGYARRLAWLCRSCLLILGFCIGKLMIYDVWNQSAGVRVISLAGLGVALYAFGFLMRKVAQWDGVARTA